MRKLLLSIVLATTAITPALAQRADRDDRETAREEREKARAERSDARQKARQERQQPAQAQQARQAPAPQAREQRQAVQQRQQQRQDVRQQRQAVQQRLDVREQRQAVQQRQQQRQDAREQRQESREQFVQHANQVRQRVKPPAGARPDRPAPPPQVTTRVPTPQWTSHWRNDRRYDWRQHRDRNRSIFRLGMYFDPFGWNYRRYNVGWRLWPSYYQRDYWLNDPWMYRLPYAPYPYQWVRYYDDALLVNTYSGQVVDVAYDFFW